MDPFSEPFLCIFDSVFVTFLDFAKNVSPLGSTANSDQVQGRAAGNATKTLSKKEKNAMNTKTKDRRIFYAFLGTFWSLQAALDPPPLYRTLVDAALDTPRRSPALPRTPQDAPRRSTGHPRTHPTLPRTLPDAPPDTPGRSQTVLRASGTR